MLPHLSEIDSDTITTLSEAKQIIRLLLNSYEELHKQYEIQQKEIVFLKQEIARLKGQPKKPQFAKGGKSAISVTGLLRGTNKKPWQKSVKGEIPIDKHIKLPEEARCECGSTTFQTIRTTTKVTQGIVITRNNTAYHGRTKECRNCHKRYTSTVSDSLKHMSFDQELKSLVSYWKFFCRMTYPLIHRMLTGFGILISYGEINEILLTNGDKLAPTQQHIKTTGFAKSTYLQSDASGAKRREKQTGKIRNQYIQVISNKLLSFFSITKHYNSQTLNRLLGKAGRAKPFVGDDGSPNGECLKCTGKQLCWVHEIRLYKKLFPYFTNYQKERDQILLQWKTFYHMAKGYGQDTTNTRRRAIEDLFLEITNQETGYADLNKKLSLTKKKQDRLLFFLEKPFLPIHNNQCEQDLREFVIQRKISRETKSVRGDKSIARHLSVIQTAHKQNLDVFQTLHGLLTGTLSPSVLTANIH